MIIWRSWGILGILIPVIVGGILQSQSVGIGYARMGIGFVIGSVIAFPLAWWLNRIRPTKQLAEWEAARKQNLDALVATGTFRYNDQTPPPSSMDEAQFQADHLFQEERKQARRNLFNRSSVFFIPMQWFAIVTLGIGILMIVNP